MAILNQGLIQKLLSVTLIQSVKESPAGCQVTGHLRSFTKNVNHLD